MINEKEQRQAVVNEAITWLRTPYHPCARVRGIGVDCAQLPAAVYQSAGVISDIPVETYSPQWHMHNREEKYLAKVISHATEIFHDPDPGDFVLFRVGRCWAHGAIVIGWPAIIHSVMGVGVVLGDANRDPFSGKLLRQREPRFFTLWASESA